MSNSKRLPIAADSLLIGFKRGLIVYEYPCDRGNAYDNDSTIVSDFFLSIFYVRLVEISIEILSLLIDKISRLIKNVIQISSSFRTVDCIALNRDPLFQEFD